MNVTVIPLRIDAHETISKVLLKEQENVEIRGQGRPWKLQNI